jgi:hypothetical protein
MSSEGRDVAPKGGDDARRAVAFMAAKFALFAILPVIVAAIIVYFTLPE